MSQNYTIQIEQDENGLLVGEIPELKACYTQAKTLPELLQRLMKVAEGSAQLFLQDIHQSQNIDRLRLSLNIHAAA